MLTELVDAPHDARVFAGALRPGLADVTPAGRVRVDALARWLQDVAYQDVADAGLDGHGAWVLRRCRIRVARFPRFGEHVELRTFCTGTGPRWAERRTSIAGVDGAAVEAAGVWIHVDAETWTPARLDAAFFAVYGGAASERRVRVRLRHGNPPPDAARAPWTFRAADLDLAGHVNNAAYWEVLEEDLDEPEALDAEAEYRTAAERGEAEVLRSGGALWVVGPGAEVRASIVVGRGG